MSCPVEVRAALKRAAEEISRQRADIDTLHTITGVTTNGNTVP
jgi:hypothetical protein